MSRDEIDLIFFKMLFYHFVFLHHDHSKMTQCGGHGLRPLAYMPPATPDPLFKGIWANLGHGGPRESSGCSEVLHQSRQDLAGLYMSEGLDCGRVAQGLFAFCDSAMSVSELENNSPGLERDKDKEEQN